jgi:hypothetical protein
VHARELLATEGNHRINFHGAARGKITGEHSHTDENEGDTEPVVAFVVCSSADE